MVPTEVCLMQKATGGTESVGKSAVMSLLDWYDVDVEVLLVMEKPVSSVDLHNYLFNNKGPWRKTWLSDWSWLEFESVLWFCVSSKLHPQVTVFGPDQRRDPILFVNWLYSDTGLFSVICVELSHKVLLKVKCFVVTWKVALTRVPILMLHAALLCILFDPTHACIVLSLLPQMCK